MLIGLFRPLSLAGAALVLASCSKPTPIGESEDEARRNRDSAADASGASTTRPVLDVNDVSILFSLPTSTAETSAYLYLLPEGAIFPAGLEDELPSLFSTTPGTPTQLYRSMQVTAFRFVPCPAAGAPGADTCRPQIRLAAQLVYPGSTPSAHGMDEVAIHLFYDLAPADPPLVAAALLALKNASPVPTTGKPLFIHPALAIAPGMQGPWGQQVRTLIERFAKKERLVRVTSMAFVFDAWPFRDSKIAGGRVVEATPLGHIASRQTSQSWDIFSDGDRIGHLDPLSTAETGAEFFSTRSRYVEANGAPRATAEVKAAVDSVERTLNPKRHSAETMDCASCHVARFLKARAIASGVSFASNDSYRPPSWANVERLQDPTIERASANIVHFGWFLRQSANEGLPNREPLPSVSERVIHDSIEAADLASKLLP